MVIILSQSPKGLLTFYIYEQKSVFFFPESIVYPFVLFKELDSKDITQKD